MAYSVSIAEAAEDDIRQAYLWYEEQKESLGNTFEKHVSKAVDSIWSNPLKTPVRYVSTRVFYLKKFPFGIHFNVTGNNILTVAVFHTSLNPEKWMER
jgi:plasmid stabilization system protein ParE